MIIEPTFLTHWKTMLIKQKLGDAAPLYVIALWGYCQTSRKAVLDIPLEVIPSICGYPGDAETLIKALVECRFVDRDGDVLKVHQWDEYNGKLISNWENGRRGGRPKANPHVTQVEPTDNPRETQNGNGLTQSKPTTNPQRTETEPTGNPSITHAEPTRLDKTGEDKTRQEPDPPIAPQGGGAGNNGESEKATDPEAKAKKAADDAWRKQVAHRLNAIFSRRDTTRWSEREVKAMRRLWPMTDEDLSLIETYYGAPIPNDHDIRRRDLLTLLNNWTGELDRARKVLADLETRQSQRAESSEKYLKGSWSEVAERAKE